MLLTDGEETRILHAVQEISTLGIAYPILLGRPSVIEQRIKKLGLHIKEGRDFELINIENDPRYQECCKTYYDMLKRAGVTPDIAKREMFNKPNRYRCRVVAFRSRRCHVVWFSRTLRRSLKNPAKIGRASCRERV